MKYADCPTVSVSATVAAAPAAVWALVSDISLPARFSTEFRGAEWLDGTDGPALGARFAGHNAHDAVGSWTTTSAITGFEVDRTFEWSVLSSDEVSSIWRYTIDDLGDGSVRLEYWFQMGPGRSGLNPAIEAMPDKEDRIVERRLAEHRANMERTVAGIKELAEADGTHR